MGITARKGWQKRLAIVLGSFAGYGGSTGLAYALGSPLGVAWAFGFLFLMIALCVVGVIAMIVQYVVDGF